MKKAIQDDSTQQAGPQTRPSRQKRHPILVYVHGDCRVSLLFHIYAFQNFVHHEKHCTLNTNFKGREKERVVER